MNEVMWMDYIGVRPISGALAAVMDIANAAKDHKARCDHNCNVSLGGLKRAAKLMKMLVIAGPELHEADRMINEMPDY